MKYDDARSKIKSGDVLAWSHQSWSSWYDIQVQLARMGTRSEYCHVGIAWCVGGRILVLESVRPSIRIFPLSDKEDFYWIPINKEWNAEVEEFALSKLGQQYSRWQAVMSMFGLNKDDTLWYCSEYVKDILHKLGIIMPDNVSPSDVVKLLQNEDYNVILVNMSKSS